MSHSQGHFAGFQEFTDITGCCSALFLKPTEPTEYSFTPMGSHLCSHLFQAFPLLPHSHFTYLYIHFSLFFEIFFCRLFLKSLLNLLQYCIYFMFLFFGHEPRGILAAQDWNCTTCTGRKSLNHWTTREVSHFFFLITPVKRTPGTRDELLFPGRTTDLWKLVFSLSSLHVCHINIFCPSFSALAIIIDCFMNCWYLNVWFV